MLTYFRNNQGPLIWMMLILVILGFVFMTGYGPVSFSSGSQAMFLIGDDKINDSDVYSYARTHFPSADFGNINRIKAELEAAYEAGNKDEEITKLKKELEETQRTLNFIGTEMAWDRAMARDGLEVNATVALAQLKKNPAAAQNYLGTDIFSILAGEKPSPQTKNKLDAAANQIQQELHMLMYASAVTTPVSMVYTMRGGFHDGSVRAKADLVVLDAGAFDNLKVSMDDSKLQAFYDEHKFSEANDGQPGYKTPDRLSLTILSAASADFTSKVEVTIQGLREHYETNKLFKWMADKKEDEEEAKPKPFIHVKDLVEIDYRLTQAQDLVKKHVEKALKEIDTDRNIDEVAREFNLRTDVIENILRSDLDEVPGYDGAYGLTRSFDADKGKHGDEVVDYDGGAALWRLDDKSEGESVSYDKVISQVREDFIRDARFKAARSALEAFKTTFDATANWDKAIDALTLDATAQEGITVLGHPEAVALGQLGPDSKPEALGEDFHYMVQDLLTAANDDSRHSTRAVDDNKNNRILLLIVRETSRADNDSQDRSFGDSFKDFSNRLRGGFLRQLSQQYRQSLFQQIRPLYN